MKMSDAIFQFPAHWPTNVGPSELLGAAVLDKWKGILDNSEKQLMEYEGIERVAYSLAVAARERIRELLWDIQRDLAKTFLTAATCDPKRAAEIMATEPQDPGASNFPVSKAMEHKVEDGDAASFFQNDKNPSHIPCWKVFKVLNDKDNFSKLAKAANGETLVAYYDYPPPPTISPPPAPVDPTVMRKAALEHHRSWWSKHIPTLLLAMDDGDVNERTKVNGLCGAYWDLYFRGTGTPSSLNPFRELAQGDGLKGRGSNALRKESKAPKAPTADLTTYAAAHNLANYAAVEKLLETGYTLDTIRASNRDDQAYLNYLRKVDAGKRGGLGGRG